MVVNESDQPQTVLAGGRGLCGGGRNRRHQKNIRVRSLVPLGLLTPAERAFIQHARFATAADAMRAVAARRLKAEIYVE